MTPVPPPPGRKPPPKKGPKPTIAPEATMASRMRGSLLGLMLGEAMGGPHEFKNLVAPQFPEMAEGPIDDLMFGGRCELIRGQTGQATQQAICLSNVLRDHAGYDQAAAAKAYVAWQEHAFDVSENNRLAILQLIDGRSPESAGKQAWFESERRQMDNSALARAAPIGLYFCRDRARRVEAALADCAITNFAPVCQIASVVHTGILAGALTTPDERISKAELLKIIEQDLALAASTLASRLPEFITTITHAAEDLREDVRLAQQDDPELYGPDLHLFRGPTDVRLAFRLSLWELFHAPTLQAAVIDVVNRGGDADTNAAITGALFGAMFGDSAVRSDWRDLIVEGPVGLTGALNGIYHPRMLMPFAGHFAPAAAPAAPVVTTGPAKKR